MSADLLKRAATKLREYAEAATPGPWEHVDHGKDGSFKGCGQVITWGEGVEGGDIAAPSGDLYPRSGYSPLEDMAFVALMHPPVALALADWLDKAAEIVAGYKSEWADRAESLFPECFAVARAILREAPDAA